MAKRNLPTPPPRLPAAPSGFRPAPGPRDKCQAFWPDSFAKGGLPVTNFLPTARGFGLEFSPRNQAACLVSGGPRRFSRRNNIARLLDRMEKEW